jgi:hypothetical protein
MSSYREKLDFLALQERVSLTWKLALVGIFALLVIAAMFLLYIPSHTVELTGIVLSHKVETSEASSRRYLFVRLDNGLTVYARVYGHFDYRPGRRIALTETKTRFFGYKWYRFNGYVEEPRGAEKTPL